MSAVASSAFRTRSNRRHGVFSESRSDRRCCPLFRNPVRTKLPAGRSSSLFYIVLFRIYLSAVVASAFRNPLKPSACRFFGISFGSLVLSAFSESRSDKASRRAELIFILYCSFPNLSVCGCCIRFSDPLKSSACRFFGILFGQRFPLRRFTHCGTADRRATNVPRRILQTMFRSVTIFMRSTVSGNSLLPNRFSDRAHNFSNAHRERITAAASFFFF